MAGNPKPRRAPYDMSCCSRRSLNDERRTPARGLSPHRDASTSEANRHAGGRRRAERVRVLEQLFDLFEGHDADEEIRRLKQQDEGF